jgi:hypothetical protein
MQIARIYLFAGQVFVDGSITAAEGGRYTMTLILTK